MGEAEDEARRYGVPEVAPGIPCWVDLATPTVSQAQRFYSALFGWTTRTAPQPESGGYTFFLKNDKLVAAVGSPATNGQPAIWSTYIAVDDADSVTARVEAAGGQVLVEPFDVPNQGRMAVFADLDAAAFSVWQPIGMPGAELFNVPGALSWSELTTPDPESAKEFYELVFGWQPIDQRMGASTYTEWRLGDRIVAGMMPTLDDHWPAELPAYWGVYFAVDDIEASISRAVELGGAVMVPPREVPPGPPIQVPGPSDGLRGRIAGLRDPQGALFSIVALTDVREPPAGRVRPGSPESAPGSTGSATPR